MKKKLLILAATIFILAICLSGYSFIYKPYIDERDKISALCDYLSQYNEEMFVNDAGMDSVEAIVEYHKELNQYSILLLLESSETVNEEQIASYRQVLEKQFSEIILIVNGEVR